MNFKDSISINSNADIHSIDNYYIFNKEKNIKVLGPNIVNIDEDLFIDDDTLLKILPGTIINFEGHHSIVSKGRVSIVGTKEKPITFNSNKKWGNLAIIGDKSSRSVIENVVFNNGSFDTYDNINLTE